ncbi:unnamed protein product [Allacma fusca]|uniref:Uncharacterized protein n=1 Tax=Allacma fusca TaxID=39272 RepID=A0A8J2J8M1_9HEXA|nr:unnamed protein product [Allacma fusca]
MNNSVQVDVNNEAMRDFVIYIRKSHIEKGLRIRSAGASSVMGCTVKYLYSQSMVALIICESRIFSTI